MIDVAIPALGFACSLLLLVACTVALALDLRHPRGMSEHDVRLALYGKRWPR
jgi:hypothetical protein